jgi:hypothetical protein
MDHEMPDAKWLNETNVKAALSDTSLEIETVDRAPVRRYTQMFRCGQFERPYDPGEIDAQARTRDSRGRGRRGRRCAVDDRLSARDHRVIFCLPDCGGGIRSRTRWGERAVSELREFAPCTCARYNNASDV